MADQDLVNEVLMLRTQNLSDDEIVAKLLYEGRSNSDVFDAMSQADVTPASEASSQGENMDYQEQQPQQQMNQMQYQYPSYSQQPAQQMQPMQQMQPSAQSAGMDADKISEIAESIIEEKWSDLIDHVNKIIEWKNDVESRITSLQEQIKGMRADFEMLNKSIMGKINDSDTVMRNVGTDLKALEEVFRKILPGFVENVNELSRITQNIKSKK